MNKLDTLVGTDQIPFFDHTVLYTLARDQKDLEDKLMSDLVDKSDNDIMKEIRDAANVISKSVMFPPEFFVPERSAEPCTATKETTGISPIDIKIHIQSDKCECGAEVCNTTHSMWCPKYKR